MTAPRVGVPVPVVYGGIAAIIALLLAVGYFAGRASNTAPVAAPAVAVHAPEPVDAPRPPATVGPAPATASNPVVSGGPNVLRPGGVASGASPAPGAAAMPPALRRDVAEYFRRIDATEGAAKTWSDPNALAQEVLSQAMRGDTGGFDNLVAASARARDGVRAITPPAPCAEHHRLTLALLDEAVVILSKLRDGVAAGDATAVAAIASSGSALEERARAADALGASLRAQYGVPPGP